ncbi:MAG: hypothetical protein HND44_20880 [Chloroflexi bacterium]|nr:hypothetical protein [Ardenticatenaceae bacterium]MBL1130900.1 hypothetical protein [Chloroflexota bacterium]NOG36997.1 hypothetical protein [Chloroflexota bacterium]
MSNTEIGRILRASTAGFAVGCRVGQLRAPAFGGLVRARPLDEREAIYGLIYDMLIDDDPLVRRLVLAESPRPSAIQDQRENRILPVEMSVMAVGYEMHGRVHHTLPPRPPLNLDPVELVDDPDDVRVFTDDLGYLRLILRAVGTPVPVDQLLVAHIASVYQIRGNDDAWAMRVIHELIELLRSNYDVLIPTLEALSNALPEGIVNSER